MTDRLSPRHRPHQQPGRPHRVTVRLSDDEQRAVDAAAAAAATNRAGYLARAALAAAADPGGIATGDLRDLQREMFAARRAVAMFGNNVNQCARAVHTTGVVPDWAGDAIRLCSDAISRLDAVTRRLDRRLR